MPHPLSYNEYAQMSGMTCPVCQCMPRFLERGPLERLGDIVAQFIECLECHATWKSIFTVTHYADLHFDDFPPHMYAEEARRG